MEQNTTECLKKFFKQILEHPERITFKVGAFDFLHDCYNVKTMTADEFARRFNNLENVKTEGIEITMQQSSQKSHQGFFASLFSQLKKLTFVNNTNSCQDYYYTTLNTTSKINVTVYFPKFLDYPATPDFCEYNPFCDYFTPQIAKVLGASSGEQISVIIGRYYELSEDLKYFLFDPTEDADSILIIHHQDDGKGLPFYYHPDLYEWLTPAEHNVSITIAPLTASTARGIEPSHFMAQRQFYLQAFIDFWTKFSLWPNRITDNMLPEDIQDVLNRFKLKGRTDVEPELHKQYCKSLPLETIYIQDQRFQSKKRFSFTKITLAHNPNRFNNLNQLTVFFPEDYLFLIDQHSHNTLDWRKDYQIPRIVNLISQTSKFSHLSILLGTWIRDSGYFIVNEAKDSRYLLVVQYNKTPVDISKIRETTVDSRLIIAYQQGEKIDNAPSPYVFMVLDLNSTNGNAHHVLSDDQKAGVWPLYCDFLTKYGVKPVTAGISDKKNNVTN